MASDLFLTDATGSIMVHRFRAFCRSFWCTRGPNRSLKKQDIKLPKLQLFLLRGSGSPFPRMFEPFQSLQRLEMKRYTPQHTKEKEGEV